MQGLTLDSIHEIMPNSAETDVRIIGTRDGQPIYIQMTVDEFLSTVPTINMVAAALRDPDKPLAITISGASVALDTEGMPLLTFESPNGATMTFGMSLSAATSLSGLLDTLLSEISGSTGRH